MITGLNIQAGAQIAPAFMLTLDGDDITQNLTLWLGWQGSALLNKGSFTVDEIEHRGAPDTLTIRGRSADFRGSLNSRREQSWHDTSLGVIVETIAARNKLTASVADTLKAIPVPHIDQAQ